MKRSLFLVLILLVVACKSGNAPVAVSTTNQNISHNFDWLLGNWQRTNEEAGKATFENWDRLTDEQYKGFGYTLQNSDTIWQESVMLVKGNEGWNFEVTGKGESSPTIFKLTQTENGSFVCENQANEFPKVIRYFKNGDILSATISGENMEIPFDFERVGTEEK